MKKIILSAAFLIALSACKEAEDKAIGPNPTTPETAVETKETAPAEPMDSVAMMKAWENYMTPGEPHKMLALENGNWDVDMTMYMQPNDPNPTKTKMMANARMILGGRYQEMTHKGNVMGMPFEGVSIVGFDNASKKIVSTWMDNMGTGIMRMEGDYDAATKTISLKGSATDPMTGKLKNVRESYVIVDNNTRKMEMFDEAPDGTEYKSMEILMKRK